MASNTQDTPALTEDLKKRINEVENNNKVATLAVERTKIAVNRLRLQYAILLERLEKKAVIPDGDELSDSSDVTEGKQIDLSKTLGEAWKQLSSEAKEPYYNIYNEDKDRYAREMKTYEANKNKKIKIEKDDKDHENKEGDDEPGSGGNDDKKEDTVEPNSEA
ncbi:putative transcription factor [Wickerhamomyces ciferrii]|uniref:Transcription factor n=1 Tax=Wickerhamomyces ciferrii (strain ATCC 14091 / BCRC 22168 / CBS 111 / JCM 3599 / NBRC 0793 / NRRL Y-1031 F-60-10) TaxID=1206466 RepID=K0KTV4_WICCF|nr:putative transcription factor [Wickerhamomyces ciferrii]CCH45452.1 putative transcription factor [Wickerhamomyces ciferrii]